MSPGQPAFKAWDGDRLGRAVSRALTPRPRPQAGQRQEGSLSTECRTPRVRVPTLGPEPRLPGDCCRPLSLWPPDRAASPLLRAPDLQSKAGEEVEGDSPSQKPVGGLCSACLCPEQGKHNQETQLLKISG